MNDEPPKYLAIKNWEKYQPNRDGKHSSWVRDYVDKDADRDYAKLTMFQRGVLDACCRLRGRFGRNIHNDPTWVSRASYAIGTDRPHMEHAISTLISRGFLIPTNQQFNLSEVHRGEERRGEENIKSIVSTPVETFQLQPPKEPPNGNGYNRELMEIWEYYIRVLGKNPKLLTLTPRRKVKGLQRFKECLKKADGDVAKAAALMKVCIDTLAASPFHRGDNEQHKYYDSWEKNLFNSTERMEQWLERSCRRASA